MPDNYFEKRQIMKRPTLFPIATTQCCLFCSHRGQDHTGSAATVRREGHKCRKYVLFPNFCHSCATEKSTDHVTSWQLPKRVRRNLRKYGMTVQR